MIGCIIQARMGSSRLPGKVLKSVTNMTSVLEFQLKQLSFSKSIEKIVIATTTLDEDESIVNFCNKNNIEFFRGNSKNVLDRYYQCAKKYNLTTIVRIPSDKPLIDPEIVDHIVKHHKSHDYVTNFLTSTYPSGTEVELVNFKTLKNIWEKAKLPSELEHVTKYIHTHQTEFNVLNIELSKNLSHLGWAVDRVEDLMLVRKIISKIDKRPILLKDILELFEKEPQLIEINKNVDRNEGNIKSLKEDENYLNDNKK
tara:strand:- start:2669 stop:3433 length:765 start_codon:yes stop_codon:yes gene_type:complete